MPCESITLPDGVRAIVCGPRQRKRRCACGKPAPLLCDWKVTGNRIGTCDVPICAACSTSPAPGKDLCPDHAAAWAAWRAQRTTAGESNA